MNIFLHTYTIFNEHSWSTQSFVQNMVCTCHLLYISDMKKTWVRVKIHIHTSARTSRHPRSFGSHVVPSCIVDMADWGHCRWLALIQDFVVTTSYNWCLSKLWGLSFFHLSPVRELHALRTLHFFWCSTEFFLLALIVCHCGSQNMAYKGICLCS